MRSISVYIYICMFWEVCTLRVSSGESNFLGESADAALSTLVKTYFSITDSESQVGFCPFGSSGSLFCLFSRML